MAGIAINFVEMRAAWLSSTEVDGRAWLLHIDHVERIQSLTDAAPSRVSGSLHRVWFSQFDSNAD